MNKYYKKINFLTGSKKVFDLDYPIYNQFDQKICDFIDDFSKKLDSVNKNYKLTDLQALSFWCRKRNINKVIKKNISQEIRVGIGLLFHITPSNVPTNFAYSLFFGLINGNSNIVKVPSKNFLQIKIICDCINQLSHKKKYYQISKMINIIKYSQNNYITAELSKICNGRVIWGGDKTISEIRSFKLPPRSMDISFADRYSFCIINSEKVCRLNKTELETLIINFYNDTYLVDQNACSSPHLIYWLGNNFKKGRNIFWNKLHSYLKKNYLSEDIISVDKYNRLLNDIIKNKNILNYQKFDNLIYTLFLKKIDINQEFFRGKWGYFYEYKAKNINELKKFINNKYQTLTYFGITKKEIVNFFSKNLLKGIDRAVPIGQALNMEFFWDGYDINKIFSRVIDIK